MPAPRWLARFNLHVTNRILGPLATRLRGWAMVVHVGRKTGREYRTPVMIFPRGDRVLIALTDGPESQWVQNILAAKRCRLETSQGVFNLSDPVIRHDERRSAMPRLVRLFLGVVNVSDFLELKISPPSTN